eukprot:824472-Prymnesium_polylepis.1
MAHTGTAHRARVTPLRLPSAFASVVVPLSRVPSVTVMCLDSADSRVSASDTCPPWAVCLFICFPLPLGMCGLVWPRIARARGHLTRLQTALQVLKVH